MNKTSRIKQILVVNSFSLFFVILLLLFSSTLGERILSSKIEFENENIDYWVARLIETISLQSFGFLLGMLNVGLIILCVHHLLKNK